MPRRPFKLTPPRAPAKRVMAESALQKQVMEFYRKTRAPGTMAFSIANERKCGVRELTRLIAMGMRPGIADLGFVMDGRLHFMELKSATGKQRSSQKTFQLECRACLIPYVLVNNLDDAIAAMTAWGALRVARALK